ncbi:MAG: hypothetical protein QXU87_03995 [Candidatus Caldarchaeum sp.]
MILLVDIVETLYNLLRDATGVRVKAAWLSPGDTAPLVTVLMEDATIKQIGMSSMMLYELRFQIDIWATSAKERDTLFDKIHSHIMSSAPSMWFDIVVTSLNDLEEEGIFRKIIMLRFRVAG